MAEVHRVGDLEIAEDIPFQERMWRAQRVGWAVFALLILAAALGLFGSGPLSAASAESGGLRVEYSRFERFESPASLVILPGPAAPAETVEVWLPHDYLRHIEVDGISPQPREVRADGDGLTYVFALQPPAGQARITFHITPQRPGLLRGQVGRGDAAARFTQIVYP